MPQWIDVFNQRKEAIIDQVARNLQAEIPAYSTLSLEDVRERAQNALPPFAEDLDEQEPRHFSAFWQNLSFMRAQQGLPLPALLKVLLIGTRTMIEMLKAAYPDDPYAQIALVEKAYAVGATGIAAVYAGYEQAHQEVISTQQSTIEEVSTPIVPIHHGILVLPVVGAIDSRRAGQIMEGLLDGINIHSADVVIMDITGVPIIDTGVANYLLQAARAARLLGSQVVLVGIGAEIAQTIVQLGIDLAGITTRANLQSGIEYALSVQGLAIRPATAA